MYTYVCILPPDYSIQCLVKSKAGKSVSCHKDTFNYNLSFCITECYDYSYNCFFKIISCQYCANYWVKYLVVAHDKF